MGLLQNLMTKKQPAAIVLGVALGVVGLAKAMVVTTGCVSATECTIGELVSGGSIMVDDVTFGGFSSSTISIKGTESIVVSGLGAGTTQVGLRYTDPADIWNSFGSIRSQGINYFVSVSSGASVIGHTLDMTGGFNVAGNSSIFIQSDILSANFSGGAFVTPFQTASTLGNFMLTGFNVNTFLEMSEFGGNVISFADLQTFDQTFELDQLTSVPVPAAVWLLGSALMLFAGFRKPSVQNPA